MIMAGFASIIGNNRKSTHISRFSGGHPRPIRPPFVCAMRPSLSVLNSQNNDGVYDFVPWVHLNKDLQPNPLQIFAQLENLSIVSSSSVVHHMFEIYVRDKAPSAILSHFSLQSARPISVSLLDLRGSPA